MGYKEQNMQGTLKADRYMSVKQAEYDKMERRCGAKAYEKFKAKPYQVAGRAYGGDGTPFNAT